MIAPLLFFLAQAIPQAPAASENPVIRSGGGGRGVPGPGPASMWVHMGGIGPRSPHLMPNGAMPQPPYRLQDNQDTWLDKMDLVFIDPVGTGYSRARNVAIARRMNSVVGDIQSVGEFIRMYVVRNNREVSPLFIAGESYGTFRAAGLGGYLIDRGIAFNGIILIGTTLNLETIWSGSDGRWQKATTFWLPNAKRRSINWRGSPDSNRGISTRAIFAGMSNITRGDCCAKRIRSLEHADHAAVELRCSEWFWGYDCDASRRDGEKPLHGPAPPDA